MALLLRRHRRHEILTARSDYEGERQDAPHRLETTGGQSRRNGGHQRFSGEPELPLDTDHGPRRALRLERRWACGGDGSRNGQDPLDAEAIGRGWQKASGDVEPWCCALDRWIRPATVVDPR